MEVVAQLVRASDCGSEGRGFETRLPPQTKSQYFYWLFCFIIFLSSSRTTHAIAQASLVYPKDAQLQKHDPLLLLH